MEDVVFVKIDVDENPDSKYRTSAVCRVDVGGEMRGNVCVVCWEVPFVI
jgi:hypothetical protein